MLELTERQKFIILDLLRNERDEIFNNKEYKEEINELENYFVNGTKVLVDNLPEN